MHNFTKKIIGALCILFMMNSVQAQNELDITGNWTVDSTYATVTFFLSQEEIDELMMMVQWGGISAEDFMDMMGFPLPTSQEEWDAIATNGLTMSIIVLLNLLSSLLIGYPKNNFINLLYF